MTNAREAVAPMTLGVNIPAVPAANPITNTNVTKAISGIYKSEKKWNKKKKTRSPKRLAMRFVEVLAKLSILGPLVILLLSNR